jgi:parvulin-like peptidyl-prolyl isomerase
MLDDLFGEQGSLITPITDDDVRDYYQANLDLFTAKERVRARHILVKTAAQAKALLARLRKAPLDLRQFAVLATEHSLDEGTRARGGDLGTFTRERPPAQLTDAITSASMRPRRIPEAVRTAAFELKLAGDVSEAVRSEDGYHLVQLGARLPSMRYDIEQVRQMILQTLREQRQKAALDAFTQQLLKDARVTIHKDKLKLVRY